MLVGQCHAGMMHGIADLALFGYGSFILSSLVRFIFHQMLVSIYHYLSRCKAE